MGAVPILELQALGSSGCIVTKTGIGIGGIILLMIAIGIWMALPEHGNSVIASGPPAANIPPQQVPAQPTSAPIGRGVVTDLWERPSAKVAVRGDRRYGFAWILRQLGATEDQLDRLADLDI